MVAGGCGAGLKRLAPFSWVRTPSGRAALRLEPNTVYYLKHPGPNLSLWRAHHRQTSFLKCTFHTACQRIKAAAADFTVFPLPVSLLRFPPTK